MALILSCTFALSYLDGAGSALYTASFDELLGPGNDSPVAPTYALEDPFPNHSGLGGNDSDLSSSSGSNSCPSQHQPYTTAAETFCTPLSMIAEPRHEYRARYQCEVDRDRGMPRRFIRAAENNSGHKYPTVKVRISSGHKDETGYIRVVTT